MTKDELKRHLAPKDTTLSDRDKDVVIRYLERDMGCIVVSGDVRDDRAYCTHAQLVKLVRGGDSRAISEQDRGVLAVRQMHAQLMAQVEGLRKRIDATQDQLRVCVREKRPESQSLGLLRARKQLEELLDRRLGALTTVAELQLKLEQAIGDAAVRVRAEDTLTTDRAHLRDSYANAQYDSRRPGAAPRQGRRDHFATLGVCCEPGRTAWRNLQRNRASRGRG